MSVTISTSFGVFVCASRAFFVVSTKGWGSAIALFFPGTSWLELLPLSLFSISNSSFDRQLFFRSEFFFSSSPFLSLQWPLSGAVWFAPRAGVGSEQVLGAMFFFFFFFSTTHYDAGE